MSDQATAAQFRYSGPITVTHLNTRKEGDEDDKVLSVDVKFEARMPAARQLFIKEWTPTAAEIEAVETAAREFLADLDRMFAQLTEAA